MAFGFGGGGKVADIWAELDLRDKNYNQKIQRARKSSVSAGATMRKAFAGIGLTFGTVGVVRGFTSIIRESAAAEEVMNRFNQVFGVSADEVRTWSNEVVNRFGASKTAALSLLASFQDFFVPLGLARKEAAKLSIQLAKLAGDLASFRDIPTAEAANILQSFLVGETRAGRSLGIVINQAVLLKKITEQTGKTNLQQATEIEKVMARLELATEFSADALGDFERTQHSLSNTMKQTGAAWNDLLQQMGDTARVGGIVDDTIRGLGNAFLWAAEGLERLNETSKEAALRQGMGGFIDVLAQGTSEITEQTKMLDRLEEAFNDISNIRGGAAILDELERQAKIDAQLAFLDSAQKKTPDRQSVDFSDPREFLRIAQEAATGTNNPVVKEQRKTNSSLDKILTEEKEQTELLTNASPLGP